MRLPSSARDSETHSSARANAVGSRSASHYDVCVCALANGHLGQGTSRAPTYTYLFAVAVAFCVLSSASLLVHQVAGPSPQLHRWSPGGSPSPHSASPLVLFHQVVGPSTQLHHSSTRWQGRHLSLTAALVHQMAGPSPRLHRGCNNQNI